MKNLLISVLVLTLVAGCTAFAPEPTPTPTITPDPCTDRGWNEIGIYMQQFKAAMGNIVVGTSTAVYLQTLQNFLDLIGDVEIDACSEGARQKIVSGMGNQAYCMQLITTGGDQDQAMNVMAEGTLMVTQAIEELAELGIIVDYP